MSSPYPVLDNKPIDQWKVTELKEELRRRKLMTKGLKEDLVKRLEEALYNEVESTKEDLGNGFNPDLNDQDKSAHAEAKPVDSEGIENLKETIVDEKDVNDDTLIVEIDGATTEIGEGIKVQDGELNSVVGTDEFVEETKGCADTDAVAEVTVVHPVSAGNSATDDQSLVTHLHGGLESNNDEFQVENEEPKPPPEDVMVNESDPNNQVSEVNPVLGFQVKCESISTDSVSINEKNELKDNLNADNVHLELEVVKPEMVQPSSDDVPAIGGDLRSSDDQETVEKRGSMEEMDESNAANVDVSKKNDSADVGSSEKLNLDRSSGEDSMEEDVLDSKQIDSNHNSDGAVDKSEPTELHVVKEGSPHDAMVGGLSPEKKDDLGQKNNNLEITSEKRKHEDKDTAGFDEPSKRHRRWNSESLKIPEPLVSNIAPSGTPRDAVQPTPKRILNRSDSALSGEAPKERGVPPSQKAATTSLRVDRFLRPFTLKAVQELLAKTGTVCNFWMDHIKTHCYVTYSSVEEAVETRNALYNLQWPPNGGRLLTAEFVDPQEVKMRVEAPPPSPVPVSPTPTTPSAPSIQSQPLPRQQVPRQQLPPPPPLPPPPAISNPPQAREHLPLPPPPAKKPEPPVVTLDDLFRKTKATPRIYYLPLSEEQVAAKLTYQGRNTRN